jgi:hypothetical protein
MLHVSRSFTAGVHNLNFYNFKGRYLEFKCTKAWLPPSWCWIIPPRDPIFDGAGWYLQSNKDGRYSRFRRNKFQQHQQQSNGEEEEGEITERKQRSLIGLDAGVAILTCAFASLDRLRS